MTREQETQYDAALAGLRSKPCMHFAPGTTITCGYRKGLILGRVRGMLWVEWADGGTEIVFPVALQHERSR